MGTGWCVVYTAAAKDKHLQWVLAGAWVLGTRIAPVGSLGLACQSGPQVGAGVLIGDLVRQPGEDFPMYSSSNAVLVWDG